MAIDFRILGPLQLCHNDTPLPLRAVKPLTMLATLILDANRPVTLRRLSEILWPRQQPDSAIANLRTHALRLRHLLAVADHNAPTPRLTSAPGCYRLRIEYGECDADRFTASATIGRSALITGDYPTARSHLATALACWRGDACESLPLDTSLDGRLIDLTEARLTAYEDYADTHLHLGLHHNIISSLRDHTSRHATRERGWQALMLALYRNGDVSAAINAYRRARIAFHDQLGIQPSPELADLYSAIKARDPRLTQPGTQPVATLWGSQPPVGKRPRHVHRERQEHPKDLSTRIVSGHHQLTVAVSSSVTPAPATTATDTVPVATNQTQQDLVGTWVLVSCHTVRSDGTIHYPFGHNPRGLLLLTSDNHASAHIIPAEKPSEDNPCCKLRGEPIEGRPTYCGYFGSFTINATTNTMTHHLHGGSMPGPIAITRIHRYHINNQPLRLQSDPRNNDFHMVWSKQDKGTRQAVQRTPLANST